MLQALMKIISPRAWSEHALVVWIRDAYRMRRWLSGGSTSLAEAGRRGRFAVVITPWSGSSVPWYSMAFGMLLAERGSEVVFMFDDMPFGENGRRRKLELACISSVLRLVQKRHTVVRLSDVIAHPDSPLSDKDISRLAQLNMVWTHRGESRIPEGSAEAAAQQLKQSDRRIAAAVRMRAFDVLFVPGGVWGTSGLWIRHAREVGSRTASYDSGGYGVLLLAVDGIACQLQDIPRAFTMLKESASTERDRALIASVAQSEMDRRRAGTDNFSSQVRSVREKDPQLEGSVLIALNSSWDSAALGLHMVFPSTREWILETIGYLLKATNVPIVVRQHPVERLAIARSADDYRALLKEFFEGESRLHFVAAEDPVNSYDLLEQASVVVAYTSTIGVEAAAQGKVVVTESSSYYASLGFVFQGRTREEYFAHLLDAVEGRKVVSSSMRADALACYYITQCCNWVKTPFTVPDFPNWSIKTMNDLANDPSVQNVLTAVETNTPVAFLNHVHRLASASPAGH